MSIIKFLILIPIFLFLLFVMIAFVGWMMRDEGLKKGWLKTFGTVTNAFPTGLSYLGVPQEQITLKYDIDGVSYEGCTTLFTHRIYTYTIGVVIPVKVNPKNLLDCRIISIK